MAGKINITESDAGSGYPLHDLEQFPLTGAEKVAFLGLCEAITNDLTFVGYSRWLPKGRDNISLTIKKTARVLNPAETLWSLKQESFKRYEFSPETRSSSDEYKHVNDLTPEELARLKYCSQNEAIETARKETRKCLDLYKEKIRAYFEFDENDPDDEDVFQKLFQELQKTRSVLNGDVDKDGVDQGAIKTMTKGITNIINTLQRAIDFADGDLDLPLVDEGAGRYIDPRIYFR